MSRRPSLPHTQHLALLLCGLLATTLPTARAGNEADAPIDVHELASNGAPGRTYEASTVIAAPVLRLCGILHDYGRYPEFMPNTAQAKVVGNEGGGTLVDMTLSLPLGKRKQYRLKMIPHADNDASCGIAWQMVPRADLAPADTIADTKGYWQLTPVPGDPRRTVVRYHVYSDPGPVPTGFGWIVDTLGRDSLPKTLVALRERARG
jgi:hypothetical protein